MVMVASFLMKHGAERPQTVQTGMIEWLQEQGHHSVTQLIGGVGNKTWETPSALKTPMIPQRLHPT